MPLFFIRRPNFAWVVALFIVLAGLLALPLLPVAQYPNVAPPQITVTATYPGASAKVLVDLVNSVMPLVLARQASGLSVLLVAC